MIKSNIIDKIIFMFNRHSTITSEQIAGNLGISRVSALEVLRIMKQMGLVVHIESNWLLNIVKTEDDASVYLERLQRNNIMCRPPVHIPLHICLDLPGYPHATEAWKKTVSIPLYPSLQEEEIEKIIAVVKEIF